MKHHNEPSPSTSIKIWILSLPGYGSITDSVDVVRREMKAHKPTRLESGPTCQVGREAGGPVKLL